jgi:hypothetical protein
MHIIGAIGIGDVYSSRYGTAVVVSGKAYKALSSGWTFLVAPFVILLVSSPAAEDELEVTPSRR